MQNDDGKTTPTNVHKRKVRWDDRDSATPSKRLVAPISQAPVERLSRTENRDRVTPRSLRQTHKGNHERRDIDSWLFPAPSARLRNQA